MLRNFFLPHPKTHKKAHLISWQAIAVYILVFVLLKQGLFALGTINPGVLGITAKVEQKQLIDLTNSARVAKGLSPVSENLMLDEAARKKGENMFEEDYWAHYSPSGKDPWGFINGEGYKFVYAGENLARNFYTSEEVVNAWMASPSHRDNILNSRYKEVGIAVLEGVLKGQRTILVVQEFGSPVEAVVKSPPAKAIPPEATPTNITNVLPLTSIQAPLIDPFKTMRTLGLTLLSVFGVLLIVDLYLIRKRGVFRITTRHLPNLVFLGVAASALYTMHSGSIL